MRTINLILTILLLMAPAAALAQNDEPHTQPASQPMEQDHAHHSSETAIEPDYGPPLPDGMSLDEVLEAAAAPPADDAPPVMTHNNFYAFLLGEQLEYRARDTDGSGDLGLEWQAWAGGDFNRVWLKTDAEASLAGGLEVEAENDLLYARLISPFWNLQGGVQYALAWADDAYDDRWSAVLALQGLAPGMFEVDLSLYFSDDLDFTATLDLEYDVRLTQRLVFQPLVELSFSAQDVPERGLGAGLTDTNLDARLRYEIKRGFAPYVGVRYQILTFGTADRARDAGGSAGTFFALAGLRFAI